MPLDAVIPPTTADPLTPHLHNKLEAAVVLRGLVQLVLDQGPVEVRARTWYREDGTHYLEAQRNRRVVNIAITGRGRERIKDMGAHFRDDIVSAISGLDKRDLARMNECLSNIHLILERIETP